MADWQARIREAYALLRQKRADEAMTRLDGADKPEAPVKARFALAQARLQAGELAPAIDALESLLSANKLPTRAVGQLAMAHNNHASQLIRSGQPDAANGHLERALELQPDLPEAVENLGRLRYAQRRFARCAELLSALEGAGDDVLELLARARLEVGDLEGAGAIAGRIGDRASGLRVNADVALHAGDGRRSREQLAAAAKIRPGDFRLAVEAATRVQPIYRTPGDRVEERRAYADGLSRLEQATEAGELAVPADMTGQPSGANFYLAYQGENDRELQERSGRLLQTWLGAEKQKVLEKSPITDRILVVSSFLRECTVGHYFRSWWGVLRNAGFEVLLMQLDHPPDLLTRSMAGNAPASIIPRAGPLPALIAEIRELRPEVVIFPEIGMHHGTRMIAAHRLAPVQVAAWGHPVTAGLASIDCFASSDAAEPPGAEAHYSERLWRLPGPGTSYEPSVAGSRQRSDFGLPGNSRVVLVPHNCFKLAPEMDAVIGRLLDADRAVELVFMEGSAGWQTALVRARLAGALGEASMKRIRWAPAMPRDDFLALCRCAEAVLDCWPFSGGNVSLDALSVGTPVVTLRGTYMRGRQTAGMLDLLGLEGCVAESVGGLADCVMAASGDAALRETILERRDALFGRRQWEGSLVEHLRDAIAGTAARTDR